MHSPIEFVPWDVFQSRFVWNQGEHVTLIGQSGSGKSTLAQSLLPYRKYNLVLVTKPRDDTLSRFSKLGYEVTRKWPPKDKDATKVVYWPDISSVERIDGQRQDVERLLEYVYRHGGWCLYVDEAPYVNDFLGLSQHLRLLWLQGRAMGVSMVAGAQRPRYLPLEAYSQATHLFIASNSDKQDVKRLSDISGALAPRVMAEVPQLAAHEFLYVNTRDNVLLKTNVRTRVKRRK